MARSGRKHSATVAGLTLNADNGDFFLLEGVAGTRGRVVEIRVFQTGVATIVLDVLRINRGAGGVAGGAITERDMDPTDTAVMIASSLPTTDVGTIDWQEHVGWNLLQELVWQPTPEWEGQLNDGDDLGIGRVGTVAHTGVGVTVKWEEESA